MAYGSAKGKRKPVKIELTDQELARIENEIKYLTALVSSRTDPRNSAIRKDMFIGDGAGQVFATICDAWEAGIQPADAMFLRVVEAAGRKGGMPKPSLAVVLTRDVTTIGTMNYFAEKIVEAAAEDKKVRLKDQVNQRWKAGEDAWEIIEQLRELEPHTESSGVGLRSGLEWLERKLLEIAKAEIRPLLPTCSALEGLEIGPGLIMGLGAPPGAGKTALALQVTFDALKLDPSLVAYIAPADTSFEVILNRIISRDTRISYRKLRHNDMEPAERRQAIEALENMRDAISRVQVLDPAGYCELLMLQERPPGLLIVDYLQKFTPRGVEKRAGIDDLMTLLRGLADRGWAILAISAIKRSATGSYESKSLGLSSFRDSSEIEFNLDSAYVLKHDGEADEKSDVTNVLLECCKNRHGKMQDFPLKFNKPRMEFSFRTNAAFDPFGGDQ
jgi:replicative DNA helicase